MKHIDTLRLREAVEHFRFYSYPNSTNHSDPCTVKDIRKVVDNISQVLAEFIDALEAE